MIPSSGNPNVVKNVCAQLIKKTWPFFLGMSILLLGITLAYGIGHAMAPTSEQKSNVGSTLAQNTLAVSSGNPMQTSTAGYCPDPCVENAQRNAVLNQVWNEMVPRKKLYADPAAQKPKPVYTGGGQRRKTSTQSAGTTTTTTKTTTTTTTTTTSASTSTQKQEPKDGKDGRLYLTSGTHVVIQPGEHIVVWADEEKIGTIGGENQETNTANSTTNTTSNSVSGSNNNSEQNSPIYEELIDFPDRLVPNTPEASVSEQVLSNNVEQL